MNLFGSIANILGFGDSDEAEELEAKKIRIKHHRDNVRNGPVKTRTMTTGQVRRAQNRQIKRVQIVNFRRAVASHRAARLEAGILRGHLQAIGVLDYISGYEPSPTQAVTSARWLARRYREADDHRLASDEVVLERILLALHRFEELTGAPKTGLPDGYTLPEGAAELVIVEAVL